MRARARHLLPRPNYWLARNQRDGIPLHPSMSGLVRIYKGLCPGVVLERPGQNHPFQTSPVAIWVAISQRVPPLHRHGRRAGRGRVLARAAGAAAPSSGDGRSGYRGREPAGRAYRAIAHIPAVATLQQNIGCPWGDNFAKTSSSLNALRQ
jgi:hypothetical protein